MTLLQKQDLQDSTGLFRMGLLGVGYVSKITIDTLMGVPSHRRVRFECRYWATPDMAGELNDFHHNGLSEWSFTLPVASYSFRAVEARCIEMMLSRVLSKPRGGNRPTGVVPKLDITPLAQCLMCSYDSDTVVSVTLVQVHHQEIWTRCELGNTQCQTDVITYEAFIDEGFRADESGQPQPFIPRQPERRQQFIPHNVDIRRLGSACVEHYIQQSQQA